MVEMTFWRSWVEKEEKSKSLRRLETSAGDDGSSNVDVADTGEGQEEVGVEGTLEVTGAERKLTHSDRSNTPVVVSQAVELRTV